MGCFGSCLSCLGNTIFYIVNFLIIIIGIALLCFGTIAMVSFECTVDKLLYEFYQAIKLPAEQVQTTQGLSAEVNIIGIILLSVGGFLVLLGMFSFIGLAPALKVLAKISVFIFIIISFILLGATIFVLVFVCLPDTDKGNLDIVGAMMEPLMKGYAPTTGGTDVDIKVQSALVDMIQSGFHCCGIHGISDYAKGGIADLSTGKFDMTLWKGTKEMAIIVPPTCCRIKDEISKGDDSYNLHFDVDVRNFPTPDTITAPGCYWNKDMAKNSTYVHTIRQCPGAVYSEVNRFRDIIIGICSGLIALWIIIITALFIKLFSDCCCKGKDDEDKDIEVKAPQQRPPPQQPVAPVQAPTPVPAIAYPQMQAYPAYPGYGGGYAGYPTPAGYPAYQAQPGKL